MLATIRKRSEREDEGFTLIELMVVVLIIAILLAIAIPTFLGARERANNRAAQSSLRNALTAAKTIYTDSQSYASATENTTWGLPTIEPSLTFVATGTASADYKEVSTNGTDVTNWYGATWAKSNVCFEIKDASGSGGNGTSYRKHTTAANCTASDARTNSASFTATGWN